MYYINILKIIKGTNTENFSSIGATFASRPERDKNYYYIEHLAFINITVGYFFSGCFVPEDVLCRWMFFPGMFRPSRCFVPLDILSLRTFCS
jgi:hypothetical protein